MGRPVVGKAGDNPLTQGRIRNACGLFRNISCTELEGETPRVVLGKLRGELVEQGRQADQDARSGKASTVDMDALRSAFNVLRLFLRKRAEKGTLIADYPLGSEGYEGIRGDDAGGGVGASSPRSGGAASRASRRASPPPPRQTLRGCLKAMSGFDEPCHDDSKRVRQRYVSALYEQLVQGADDPVFQKTRAERTTSEQNDVVRFWVFAFKVMRLNDGLDPLVHRAVGGLLKRCSPESCISSGTTMEVLKQFYDMAQSKEFGHLSVWWKVFNDRSVHSCLAAQDGRSHTSQASAIMLIHAWLQQPAFLQATALTKDFLEGLVEGHPLLPAYCNAWLRWPMSSIMPTPVQFYHGFVKAKCGTFNEFELRLLSRALERQPRLLSARLSQEEQQDTQQEQQDTQRWTQRTIVSLFELWKADAKRDGLVFWSSILSSMLVPLLRLEPQPLGFKSMSHVLGEASRELLPDSLRQPGSFLPRHYESAVLEGLVIHDATSLLRLLSRSRPEGMGLADWGEWLTGAGVSPYGRWLLWRAYQPDLFGTPSIARMMSRFIEELRQFYAQTANLVRLCSVVTQPRLGFFWRLGRQPITTNVGRCKDELRAWFGEGVFSYHVVEAFLWSGFYPYWLRSSYDSKWMRLDDLSGLGRLWDRWQRICGEATDVERRQFDDAFLGLPKEVLHSLLAHQWSLLEQARGSAASTQAFELWLERLGMLGPHGLLAVLYRMRPLKAWCFAKQHDIRPDPAYRENAQRQVERAAILTPSQKRLACSKLGLKRNFNLLNHLMIWMFAVVGPLCLVGSYVQSLLPWGIFQGNTGLVDVVAGGALLSVLGCAVLLHRRRRNHRIVNRWLTLQRCDEGTSSLGKAEGFHRACMRELGLVPPTNPTSSSDHASTTVPPQHGKSEHGSDPAPRHVTPCV